MREILKEILEKYPNARATTVFGGQHEIRSLFENLKDEFSALDFVRDNKNRSINNFTVIFCSMSENWFFPTHRQ